VLFGLKHKMDFVMFPMFYHRVELRLDLAHMLKDLVFSPDNRQIQLVDVTQNLSDVGLVNNKKFALHVGQLEYQVIVYRGTFVIELVGYFFPMLS